MSLRTPLAPELVDWFARELRGPQIHLVGLRPGDLERWFAAITELAPR